MGKKRYKDFPFGEVVKAAEKLVQEGHSVYQKWSCRHCGVRQIMAEKNGFWQFGKCEVCGKITDIQARGCNYTVVAKIPGGKQ